MSILYVSQLCAHTRVPFLRGLHLREHVSRGENIRHLHKVTDRQSCVTAEGAAEAKVAMREMAMQQKAGK